MVSCSHRTSASVFGRFASAKSYPFGSPVLILSTTIVLAVPILSYNILMHSCVYVYERIKSNLSIKVCIYLSVYVWMYDSILLTTITSTGIQPQTTVMATFFCNRYIHTIWKTKKILPKELQRVGWHESASPPSPSDTWWTLGSQRVRGAPWCTRTRGWKWSAVLPLRIHTCISYGMNLNKGIRRMYTLAGILATVCMYVCMYVYLQVPVVYTSPKNSYDT